MKKLLFITFLCFLSSITVLSQTSNQIVRIDKRYFMDDKALNGNDLKKILTSDQSSAPLYQKYKRNSTVGIVFLAGSLGFIGYAALNPPKESSGPLPGLISDEEMKKWMVPVYASIGCIAVSIPFLVSGLKNFKQSVNVYNSKHTTGYQREMKLDLGFTPTGIGMVCRF